MRWKTPSEGDRRERTIFAWLPIQCSNGETVWLEKVKLLEVKEHQADGLGHCLQWVIRHAETVS